MANHQNTLNSITVTPDVLEAAQILVLMKQGMRAFLEAQKARYRIPYLYYASLNPAVAQLHYFSSHGFPFSPLYDISPITPAAYHFPLAQAQACSLPQQEAYYGMLTSPQCIVGPPREQSAAACAVSTEVVVEGETLQPAAKKARLSNTSSGSPEQTVTAEKQESKRKRKNLTKEQLEILESVYEKDKYPHIDDRIKLEKPTNLTEDRIQVWFQNRRAKDRKRLEAEKLQQYFENSQKGSQEYQENGMDVRNATIKTEQSPARKNSNSDRGSDISENGESDGLSFNESPTK